MEGAFSLFKAGLEGCLSWFNAGLNYTGVAPYLIGVITAMLVVSLLIAPIRGVSYLSFGDSESQRYKKEYARYNRAQKAHSEWKENQKFKARASSTREVK